MNKEFKYEVGNVPEALVLKAVYQQLLAGQNLEAFVTISEYYSNALAQFHVNQAIKALLETEAAK